MIKFPMYYEVGELLGHQVAARECYIAMIEMKDQQQTMCIGEQRALAKVNLDNARQRLELAH